MFKKSNAPPERKKFSLKPAEILEDLEAVCGVEQQRNKLFECLDDKPLQERKCDDIEGFLKGTQKLEEISKMLQLQVVKLGVLANSLTSSIDEIESKIETYQ